jgi:adenylate cyclase
MTSDANEDQSSYFLDPREMRKAVSAYDRFIPYQILQMLGKHRISEVQLGDHIELPLTILFSDIRDFTSLSETLTPQENFNFINSYFGQMEPIITVNNGIIDKFIGDAIMALFTDANDAVIAAAMMCRQLGHYNAGRARAGYRPINLGMGLNTGMAMLGVLGGSSRMEATVISDAVNLASRFSSPSTLSTRWTNEAAGISGTSIGLW